MPTFTAIAPLPSCQLIQQASAPVRARIIRTHYALLLHVNEARNLLWVKKAKIMRRGFECQACNQPLLFGVLVDRTARIFKTREWGLKVIFLKLVSPK
jgi:hypothetical protein